MKKIFVVDSEKFWNSILIREAAQRSSWKISFIHSNEWHDIFIPSNTANSRVCLLNGLKQGGTKVCTPSISMNLLNQRLCRIIVSVLIIETYQTLQSQRRLLPSIEKCFRLSLTGWKSNLALIVSNNFNLPRR